MLKHCANSLNYVRLFKFASFAERKDVISTQVLLSKNWPCFRTEPDCLDPACTASWGDFQLPHVSMAVIAKVSCLHSAIHNVVSSSIEHSKSEARPCSWLVHTQGNRNQPIKNETHTFSIHSGASQPNARCCLAFPQRHCRCPAGPSSRISRGPHEKRTQPQLCGRVRHSNALSVSKGIHV